MTGKLKTPRRQRAWDMTGGICFYCRIPLLDDFTRIAGGSLDRLMQVDHQAASCRGGGNNAENLVPCCGPCNVQKGHKTPAQFREYLIRIGVKPRFFGWNEVDRDWLCVSSVYRNTTTYAGIGTARKRFKQYAPKAAG